MGYEHIILFAGPVGAGKTTAISTLSEIPVVSTEAINTDFSVSHKATTTVAMDYGQISLEEGHLIRLYGVPGQERFDFVWKLFQERAAGLVLLLDESAKEPLTDLDFFLDRFAGVLNHGVAVVGITRSELSDSKSLSACCTRLQERRLKVPVFEVDARDREQMVVLLTALVSMVQMRETQLEAD